MAVRRNLKTVHKSVKNREDFNCNGTLTGVNEHFPNFGWAANTMAGVSLANHILGTLNNFVVYSYDTPIAVYNHKGWWKNDAKYSVTTSRHMGAIGMGIN